MKSGRSARTATERRSSGMPCEDRGQGIGDGAPLGGFGVEVEGAADHHGAEVEGPGDRRGDHHQAERGALVGAGEVGVALGVEGVGAGAGADVDGADCEEAGQLGSACSSAPFFGCFARVAAGDLGLGALRDPGQLAGQARGQGGFDLGQALGAVFAAELEEQRAVWRRLGSRCRRSSLGALGSWASVVGQAPPRGAGGGLEGVARGRRWRLRGRSRG